MKIWLNLLWKEWHEQQWKLLSLTAIALSVCLTLMCQDLGNVEFSLIFTIFSFAIFAPIVVGMGVCAGEHASGVIRFVRAQPVPMRCVATVRWIVGACVLVIPLFGASAMCWIAMFFEEQVGPRSVRTAAFFELQSESSETSTLLLISAAGMAACLNLYAWIVAIAVNQRTEFRAGLVGLLVTAGTGVAGISSLSGWDNHLPNVSIPNFFCLISGPLVSLGMIDFVRNSLASLVLIAVVWQLMLMIGLMLVMVFRYGREERWLSRDFFHRTYATAQESSALGKPRSSQWRALLWLQLRQSIPVCIVGLCISLLTVAVSAGFEPDTFDFMYPALGCVLALLIGVGSFVSELQPDLHMFWRSRPISPGSWFWFKYIGGAIALIGLFDAPCMLLAWSGVVRTVSPGFAAVFPMLLHLLCYSLAVFAACSVRHSSYSTVLAVCALLVIIIPELAEFQVPRFLSFFTMWRDAALASESLAIGAQGYRALWQTGYYAIPFLLPACILIGAIALPATVAAAYLVKRDISLGS